MRYPAILFWRKLICHFEKKISWSWKYKISWPVNSSDRDTVNYQIWGVRIMCVGREDTWDAPD